MRIDKISKDQLARFAEWSRKWIDIGLSTEPADFDSATEAALKAYALCNLGKPMVVLRMGSPYGATMGGALAWALLREMGKKPSQVWSQVRSQVGSQVGSQVESHLRNAVYNDRGGAFWSGWCAYVSFFRDVMGWRDEVLSKFEIDEALTKSCGWVWWHENILAISDRPSVIRRDEQGRLHCADGPSIAYRDGWALHHWHGTAIPEAWAKTKPAASEVLGCENVEQRRAGCELVGWDSILTQLNAKVIDKDADEQIGTLLEVELPDAGKERFLRVRCGTGRYFALPVDPKAKTALEANLWTYGLPPDRTLMPKIRT